MASTYLTRGAISTSTDNTKGTFSCWFKRGSLGNSQTLFCGGTNYNYSGADSKDNRISIDNDYLQFYQDDYSVTGNNTIRFENTLLRDTSAWYHLVVAVDTGQGDNANKVKFYLNGTQLTASYTSFGESFSNLFFNTSGLYQLIGTYNYDTNNNYKFDGSMSHIHFIDGTAYDATAFGEYDANGVWKINTSPSVTYGTNGFFILKDGNSVTDQSGNSNNFTVGGGTLTNTEDSPSNVFCTANALSKGSDTVLSNGNTTARNDTGNNSNTLGTIGFGNGKYYWEAYRHGGGNDGIGICLASADGSTHSSVESGRVLYYENGSILCDGLSDQSNISTGVTYGDTDIISVSFDTENGVLKFYKNDTLVSNSTITNSKFTNAENIWVPHTYQINGGEWRLNFGNGYFGTTAVSSAGTNASGNGIFEFDVPTGYTALSTKGLNL